MKDRIVIVKFFCNTNQENSSKLITRTLGKVGFISKSYRGQLPRDEEFWRCRIVDETRAGERNGCFLLEPLSVVREIELSKLLQGFYTEKLINGVLVIKPKIAGDYILPLAHKKSISDAYAILVDLSEKPL